LPPVKEKAGEKKETKQIDSKKKDDE